MKKWIWLHPSPSQGAEEWKRQFERFRRAGIEAILPCLYNGREALYESRHLPVAGPVLEEMLPVAAAFELEVHVWMVALRCNVESVQREHPEWFTLSREGRSSLQKPPYIAHYQWLCPTRPEVRAFVAEIVAELAAYGELRGIHLDYIRHADVILPEALQPKYELVQDGEFAQFDFCYCEVCRAEFRRRQGVDVREMREPAADEAWRAFRHSGVLGVVAEAERRRRDKFFTAAVFATPELSRQYVRQDWPAWPLDAVFPMLYHNFYNEEIAWIETATREGVQALAGKCPLHAGVYIPALEPGELGRALAAAAEGGAAGISLFCAESMRDEHWRALQEL